MAYDIHLARKKGDAIKSSPKISLSEEIHESIFKNQIIVTNKFPMLKSMENFYRDTTYFNSSLENLHTELLEIKHITNNSECHEFINSLLTLVVEAKKEHFNIYCFCD